MFGPVRPCVGFKAGSPHVLWTRGDLKVVTGAGPHQTHHLAGQEQASAHTRKHALKLSSHVAHTVAMWARFSPPPPLLLAPISLFGVMLIVGFQWLRSLLLWDATRGWEGVSVSMATVVAKGGVGGWCAWRNGEETVEEGGGELTIMVCTLQGNYAEWGRGECNVRVYVWVRVHVSVCVENIMGCLPPDLFVCARARKRKEEKASCAHATTHTHTHIPNTHIF